MNHRKLRLQVWNRCSTVRSLTVYLLRGIQYFICVRFTSQAKASRFIVRIYRHERITPQLVLLSIYTIYIPYILLSACLQVQATITSNIGCHCVTNPIVNVRCVIRHNLCNKHGSYYVVVVNIEISLGCTQLSSTIPPVKIRGLSAECDLLSD